MIGVASALFGKTGCLWVSGAAGIYTISQIFTSWLMILQIVTVFAGLILGFLITEAKNYKETKETAWGIVFLLVIAAGYFYVKSDSNVAKNPAQVTAPAVPVSVQSNSSILAQADEAEKRKMEALIVELETKYPVLNEKSSQYNQQIVDEALSRQRVYIQQGQSGSNALQMAVIDMVRENTTTSTQNNPAATPAVNNQAQYLMEAMERKNGHVISGTKEANQYQRALSGDFSAYRSTDCIYKTVMTEVEIARCRR